MSTINLMLADVFTAPIGDPIAASAVKTKAPPSVASIVIRVPFLHGFSHRGFATPGGVVRAKFPLATASAVAPERLGACRRLDDKEGSRGAEDAQWPHCSRFHARDLHLVMGPAAPLTSVRIRELIAGQPPGAAHGIDVDEQGNGTVTVLAKLDLTVICIGRPALPGLGPSITSRTVAKAELILSSS